MHKKLNVKKKTIEKCEQENIQVDEAFASHAIYVFVRLF